MSEINHKENINSSLYSTLNTAENIIACAKMMRGSQDFYSGIHDVLLAIKDLIPCERIYILITDVIPVNILSEWTAPGLKTATWIFSRLRENNIRTVDEVMKSQDVVVIRTEEFKEKHPNEYLDMVNMNLRNTLAAPLYDDNVMFGNLCLDNFDFNTALNAKEFMQAIAFFIASEIRTHRLMKRLETISNTDPLTGLKNRYAMNLTISELKNNPCSLGILFVDINGLKKTNDNYGHEKGDELIKRTANTLIQSFGHDKIYRAGGDEFLVIMDGISEEAFFECVNKLKSILAKENVLPFSYGFQFSSMCNDPKLLIEKADKAMYDAKKAYYDEK